MPAILLCLLVAAAADQSALTPTYPDSVLQRSDAILAELEALPEGIAVRHAPGEVVAARVAEGEFRYRWTYETSVASRAEDLTLVEFGCFNWTGERWVFANVTGAPFTAADFASWYACPGAALAAGDVFSDPSNWNASACLRAGRSMWYYVGQDARGKRFKGTAVVELRAEVRD